MENVRKVAKVILEKGFLLSLGTVDKGGVWVADVVYVSDDDLNIYWLSKPDTRHSKAIEKNPKVAGTITLITKAISEDIGLQIEGVARRVEGDMLEIAKKYNVKRGRPLPKQEGEIFKEGRQWYILKPTKIEVIYDEFFGREKKIIILK